jgi:transposase-like protein
MVALLMQACFNHPMKKADAIQALGGSVAAVAREVGITPQAVGQWPEDLPPAIRDRVQAALWRRAEGTEGAPDVPADQPQEVRDAA